MTFAVRIAAIATVAVFVLRAAEVARASPDVIAVCAPGSPGTTADAQSAMDGFAAALSAKSGTQVSAVYDDTEDAGVARMKTARVGMVSLPFFLKHEQDLMLHAQLAAVRKDRPAADEWVLVAKKGRVHGAASLDGFTITSSAAYAPGFVRGTVLGGLGAIPSTVKLQQSGAVLSALRKAAKGDAVAVVLDGPGASQLSTLPFAGDLEVVARSAKLPAGLVVTIDAGPPAGTWKALEGAFLGLRNDRAGATALDGIQMDRFVKVDADALAAARKAYDAASK
jgi:hypothetical protein